MCPRDDLPTYEEWIALGRPSALDIIIPGESRGPYIPRERWRDRLIDALREQLPDEAQEKLEDVADELLDTAEYYAYNMKSERAAKCRESE